MNKQEPFVITISREVGSGGHTVGSILAKKLNVPYCDKHLVESLQKQFNLTESQIEELKGKKKSWLNDFLKRITPTPSANALGLDGKFTQEFSVEVTSDHIY